MSEDSEWSTKTTDCATDVKFNAIQIKIAKAGTMQSDAGKCTDATYVAKLSKLSTKMVNAAAGM